MEIKIYYQDTDCGGVVYYGNYMTYFERARTEWLSDRGISVLELMEKNILFVVAHAEIDYKSPAKYGEIIRINTTLGNISRVQLEFSYLVEEKNSNRLIVTGKTNLACVDKNFKLLRLPDEIKNKILKDGKNL